jgi:hypothetical protein
LVLTASITIATVGAPRIKKRLMIGKSSNISTIGMLVSIIYYLIYSALHVASMLLIMTFNGGVLLVMIISMMISYSFFGSED